MRFKRSAIKLLLIGSLSLVLVTGIQLLGGTHPALAAAGAAASDSCTLPSTSGTPGYDKMTISVPQSGTYELWTEMEIPSSGATGVLMDVNGATDCFNVGDTTSISPGTMQWINYTDGNVSNTIEVPLTQGNNTIELIGSGGVVVTDIEALSPDSACRPTGDGSQCAPTSVAKPTVQLTAPTPGSPVSGASVALSADAASAPGVSAVGIATVAFEVNGKVVGQTSTAPYTINWDSSTSGLVNGTYPLVAVATDTQGQSTTSASENITVANNVCSSTPTPPTALSATNTTTTSTTLTWTAPPLTSGCTIDSYTVEVGGVAIGTPSNTTTATITDLTPGTKYNFTVVATNNAGTPSSPSTALPVTTTASSTTTTSSTAPLAPTDVTVAAVSSTEVNLTWVASTSSDVTGYYVYRNSQLVYTGKDGSAISYEDNSVKPDNTYTYTVAAYNSAGSSAKAATDPTSVTTPQALGGGGSSTTGSSTTGSSTTGSSTTGSSTTGSSTTGNSGSSTTGSSTTGKGSSTSGKGSSTSTTGTSTGKGKGGTGKWTPPSKPSSPGAPVVTGTGVVVTWGRGRNHGGRGIAGWHIYENNRIVFSVTINSGSGSSVTITGLKPNTKYTFYIVAYNADAQTSSRSSSFNVRTERRL